MSALWAWRGTSSVSSYGPAVWHHRSQFFRNRMHRLPVSSPLSKTKRRGACAVLPARLLFLAIARRGLTTCGDLPAAGAERSRAIRRASRSQTRWSRARRWLQRRASRPLVARPGNKSDRLRQLDLCRSFSMAIQCCTRHLRRFPSIADSSGKCLHLDDVPCAGTCARSTGLSFEAHELLDPAGRLVVQVPNAASWQFLMFGEHWNGVDVPRHLWNFRVTDLEKSSTGADLKSYAANTFRCEIIRRAWRPLLLRRSIRWLGASVKWKRVRPSR